MSTQHLSDEAIAAFADGVLTGLARERATRHTTRCPECAHAVAVQREAVWALRAAPAPALPGTLLDRLRAVPQTTPINLPQTALGPDGSMMFAAFGTALSSMTTAAAVAPKTDHRTRVRPLALTAATVAAAGVLAVSSVGHTSGHPAPIHPGSGGAQVVVPAGFTHLPGDPTGLGGNARAGLYDR